MWPGRLAEVQVQAGNDNSNDLIDTYKVSDLKYTIAVAKFVSLGTDASSERNIAELYERLSANLLKSVVSDSINQSEGEFLEAEYRAGLDDGTSPDFPAWSKMGAKFLIKGGITSSDSK